MKHRRAGPQRPTVHRARPARPAPKKPPTKARPAKATKATKVRPGVPRPIGPWLAMSALLEKTGVRAPVILDIGAHFGNVAAMFLKMWPDATVYCFEPEPKGIARLEERFAEDSRVTIIPSALGSRSGHADFYVGGQSTEMSSLLPRAEWKGRRYYRHEIRETIEVPVLKLDDFVELYKVNQVHLIKMDVQGGEKYVLRGGRKVIASGNVWAIYSEVLFVSLYEGAALFWELCAQMEQLGCSLFDVYNLQRSWINRQLKYGDALWLGPKLRKAVNDYPEEWLRKSLDRRMCPGR